MIQVTKEKWKKISKDYKGRWTTERDDVPKEWKGKRTVLSGCVSDELGALLIEATHFVIAKEANRETLHSAD